MINFSKPLRAIGTPTSTTFLREFNKQINNQRCGSPTKFFNQNEFNSAKTQQKLISEKNLKAVSSIAQDLPLVKSMNCKLNTARSSFKNRAKVIRHHVYQAYKFNGVRVKRLSRNMLNISYDDPRFYQDLILESDTTPLYNLSNMDRLSDVMKDVLPNILQKQFGISLTHMTYIGYSLLATGIFNVMTNLVTLFQNYDRTATTVLNAIGLIINITQLITTSYFIFQMDQTSKNLTTVVQEIVKSTMDYVAGNLASENPQGFVVAEEFVENLVEETKPLTVVPTIAKPKSIFAHLLHNERMENIAQQYVLNPTTDLSNLVTDDGEEYIKKYAARYVDKQKKINTVITPTATVKELVSKTVQPTITEDPQPSTSQVSDDETMIDLEHRTNSLKYAVEQWAGKCNDDDYQDLTSENESITLKVDSLKTNKSIKARRVLLLKLLQKASDLLEEKNNTADSMVSPEQLEENMKIYKQFDIDYEKIPKDLSKHSHEELDALSLKLFKNINQAETRKDEVQMGYKKIRVRKAQAFMYKIAEHFDSLGVVKISPIEKETNDASVEILAQPMIQTVELPPKSPESVEGYIPAKVEKSCEIKPEEKVQVEEEVVVENGTIPTEVKILPTPLVILTPEEDANPFIVLSEGKKTFLPPPLPEVTPSELDLVWKALVAADFTDVGLLTDGDSVLFNYSLTHPDGIVMNLDTKIFKNIISAPTIPNSICQVIPSAIMTARNKNIAANPPPQIAPMSTVKFWNWFNWARQQATHVKPKQDPLETVRTILESHHKTFVYNSKDQAPIYQYMAYYFKHKGVLTSGTSSQRDRDLAHTAIRDFEAVYIYNKHLTGNMTRDCTYNQWTTHKMKKTLNEIASSSHAEWDWDPNIIYRLLSTIVSSGVAITDGVAKTNIGKNFITAYNFKKCFQSTVDESTDLGKVLFSHMMGVDYTGHGEHLQLINRSSAKLMKWLSLPNPTFMSQKKNYFDFRDDIEEAKKLVTKKSDNRSDSGLMTANQLLQGKIVISESRLNEIAKEFDACRQRIETCCVDFVGLAGAGKSYFAQEWFIPEICKAMGWSPSVYNVNFGGKEYWPPYHAQPCAMYDEFKALRENDPLIKEFNQLCSCVSFNMAAAAVEKKVQPCSIQLMVCASNLPYVNLNSVLTPPSAEAFYSRLNRYTFINLQQTPEMVRNEIPHSVTFDNDTIEIRKHFKPASSASNVDYTASETYDHMRDVDDPYIVITKEQLVNEVTELLKRKEEDFNRQQEAAKVVAQEIKKIQEDREAAAKSTPEGEVADGGHLTILWSGRSGTGKSLAADKVGKELSELTRMPFVNCLSWTSDNLASKIRQPSVIVTNDMINTQDKYQAFYDELPTPCIIINTANVYIENAWARPPKPAPSGGWMDWIIDEASTMRRVFSGEVKNIRCPSAINPSEGWTRRVGLPGYVQTAVPGETSVVWVNPSKAIHFESGTGFQHFYEGKQITESAITEKIFNHFSTYYKYSKNVELIPVDEFTIDEPWDVELHAKDIPELVSHVNDVCKCMKMYHNAQTRKIPFVIVSERAVKSKFNFSPALFHIEDTTDLAAVTDMALQTYGVLRNANLQHTVRIFCNGEFEARGIGSKLEYRFGDEIVKKRMVNYYCELSTDKTEVNIFKIQNDTKTWECSYKSSDVASVYEQGLHTTDIPIKYFRALEEIKENFYRVPANKALKIHYQIKKVSIDDYNQALEKFKTTWTMFQQTTAFKVIAIFLGLAASAVFVSLLVLLIKAFLPKKEEKKTEKEKKKSEFANLPDTVADMNAVLYDVTYSRGAKSGYVVAINTYKEDVDAVNKAFIKKQLTALIRDVEENATIESFTFTDPETFNDEERVSKANRRQKANYKKRPIKNDLNTQTTPEGKHFDCTGVNPCQESVINKIQKNMVKVQGQGYSNYGMGLKGNYVMTVAHIAYPSFDTRMICYVHHNGVPYPAKIVFLDRANETLILEIIDKTHQAFADITGFFIKDDYYYGPVMLLKPRGKAFDRLYGSCETHTYQVPLNVGGVISVSNNRKHTIMSVQGPPTTAGDCGSPIIATHPSMQTTIICGIHFARDSDNTTRSTVCSQEKLNQYFAQKNSVAEAYSPEVDTRFTDTELGLTDECIEWLYKVPIPDGSVCPITTVYTDNWLQDLASVYNEEGDTEIFVDQEDLLENENEDRNVFILGYDKTSRLPKNQKNSHEQTPWLGEIIDELPIEKQNAIFDVEKVVDPSNLVTVKGKKDILLTNVHFYNDPVEWNADLERHAVHVSKCKRDKQRSWYAGPHRYLTELEVLNGLYVNPRCPFYEGLEPMDRDTSAGHYFAKAGKMNSLAPALKVFGEGPRSQTFYTWADNKFGKFARTLNEIEWKEAGNGNALMLPGSDKLKSELVKLKNAAIGKTRLFNVPSKNDALYLRKVTGTIQAAIKKQVDVGWSAIGCDPLVSFSRFYQKMSEYGGYGFAADFGNYDKHQVAPLMHRAFQDWAYYFCSEITDEATKKDVEIRFAVAAYRCINSINVADGHVYVKRRGVGSGTGVTACLNNETNVYIHGITARILIERHNALVHSIKSEKKEEKKRILSEAYPLFPYSEHWQQNINPQSIFSLIYLKVYGDDVVVAVKTGYEFLFNFHTFHEIIEDRFGVAYTNPDKSTAIPPPVVPLAQLEFLSRTFSADGDSMFILPPLKTSTIVSYLHWTRDNSPAQWKTNIEMALAEACLHKPEFYHRILEAARKAVAWIKAAGYNIEINLPDYEFARSNQRYITMYGRHSLAWEGYNVTNEEPEINECEITGNYNISRKSEIEDYFNQDIRTMNYDERSVISKKAHELLSSLTFPDSKHINAYISKAAVKLNKTKTVIVSAMFDVKVGQALDIEKFTLVQKDIQNALNQALIPQETLKYRDVEIIHRPLPTGFAECYQITFYWKKSMGDLLKRTRNLDVSSTAESAIESQGMTKKDGELHGQSLDVEPSYISPSLASKGIYTKDVCKLMREPMQVSRSEIVIETVANFVVHKLIYGVDTFFSVPMKAYAALHSRISGPIRYDIHIVAPSTLTAELIVGVSQRNKEAYQPWELQLVKWNTMSVGEATYTVTLNHTMGDDGNLTGWTDIISDPSKVVSDREVIVIMTRTPIQNSYDNKGVSAQIFVNASFTGETRLIATPESLMGPVPPTRTYSDGFRVNTPFEEIFGVPSKNINIFTDGDIFIKQGKYMQVETKNPPVETFMQYMWEYKVTPGYYDQAYENGMNVNAYTHIIQGDVGRDGKDHTLLYASQPIFGGLRSARVEHDYMQVISEVFEPGYILTEREIIGEQEVRMGRFFAGIVPDTNHEEFVHETSRVPATHPLKHMRLFQITGTANIITNSNEISVLILVANLQIESLIGVAPVTVPLETIPNDNKQYKALSCGMVTYYMNEGQQLRDMVFYQNTPPSMHPEANILPPNYACLKMSKDFPIALSGTAAESGNYTIFNESEVLNSIDKFAKIAYGKNEGFIHFELGLPTVSNAIAQVIYNMEQRVFYINTGTITTGGKYRIFPKLPNSEIIVRNVKYEASNLGIRETPTSNWINRVTKGGEVLYRNQLMSKREFDIRRRNPDISIIPEASMLAGLAGGALGGIGQALTDAQNRKHELEMQKRQNENAMAMLQEQLSSASALQKEQIKAQMQQLSAKMENDMAMLQAAASNEKDLLAQKQGFSGSENAKDRDLQGNLSGKQIQGQQDLANLNNTAKQELSESQNQQQKEMAAIAHKNNINLAGLNSAGTQRFISMQNGQANMYASVRPPNDYAPHFSQGRSETAGSEKIAPSISGDVATTGATRKPANLFGKKTSPSNLLETASPKVSQPLL